MVDIGNESHTKNIKKSQYILWSLVYTVTKVEFQYFCVFEEHCENGLYSKDCFKQKCATKEIIA